MDEEKRKWFLFFKSLKLFLEEGFLSSPSENEEKENIRKTVRVSEAGVMIPRSILEELGILNIEVIEGWKILLIKEKNLTQKVKGLLSNSKIAVNPDILG